MGRRGRKRQFQSGSFHKPPPPKKSKPSAKFTHNKPFGSESSPSSEQQQHVLTSPNPQGKESRRSYREHQKAYVRSLTEALNALADSSLFSDHSSTRRTKVRHSKGDWLGCIDGWAVLANDTPLSMLLPRGSLLNPSSCIGDPNFKVASRTLILYDVKGSLDDIIHTVPEEGHREEKIGIHKKSRCFEFWVQAKKRQAKKGKFPEFDQVLLIFLFNGADPRAPIWDLVSDEDCWAKDKSIFAHSMDERIHQWGIQKEHEDKLEQLKKCEIKLERQKKYVIKLERLKNAMKANASEDDLLAIIRKGEEKEEGK